MSNTIIASSSPVSCKYALDSPLTSEAEEILEINTSGQSSNDGTSCATFLHFHPYKTRQTESNFACIKCKKQHKKCDRGLPECLRCIASGFKCYYENPKPRKKKYKKDNLPTSTVSVLGFPSESTQKREVIVSIQNPSINSTVNGVTFYLSNTVSFFDSGIEEIIPLETIKKMIEELDERNIVEKAYLYSIQAFAEQRMGSKELAEISFQHAKLLLAPHFDTFEDVTVGVTLVYFTSYTFAIKKYRSAFIFLDLVKYFVGEGKSLEAQNLIKWTKFLKIGMNFTLEYEKNGARGIVEYMPYLLSQLFSIPFNGDPDELSTNLDMYATFVKYVLLQEKFNEGQELSVEKKKSREDILSLMLLIASNGYKLAYLVCSDPSQRETIWALASSIVNAANHEYFSHVPHLVLPFVDLALAEHAKIASEINNSEKIFVMIQDLNLIQTLNNKFDRIDEHYSKVEKTLDNLVSKHTSSIYTSLHLDI